MAIQLTPKNLCAGAVAVTGSGLALIMGAVSPEHLASWRWAIIALAIIAAIGSILQMFLQSREDRDLNNKIDKLIAAKGVPAEAHVQVEHIAAGETNSESDEKLEGEIYRLVMSPRSSSWELVRDLYRVSGRANEFSIDCDALVEMYLVNSSDRAVYLRDIRLSVELNGKGRMFLERQEDFRAIDFADERYEYGLAPQRLANAERLRPLLNELPLELSPRQPIEGWVRFMARDINPEEIVDKTWQVSIIDSLGKEHAVSKVSTRTNSGEIGLRRIRD
jgi:hypothetical protein